MIYLAWRACTPEAFRVGGIVKICEIFVKCVRLKKQQREKAEYEITYVS